MFEISVKTDFAASHQLGKGYKGKCSSLHGHTWKVEVILKNDKLDDIGMVMDFQIMKKHLKDLLDELDHAHLNDVPAFKDENPTTENIARFVYEEYSKIQPLKVKSVTVWESDSAKVTYYKK